MTPLAWAGLVAAGAVGSCLRHVVGGAVTARAGTRFPWGTVVVNVTGSFVLGVITGLALRHTIPDNLRVVLGTGLCGAYTTFSTASVDTVERPGNAAAAGYALGMVAACMAAAAVGLVLAG